MLITSWGILINDVFVDDLLFFAANIRLIMMIKSKLFKIFSMKDLGPVSKCFGINITRDRAKRTIYLDQSDYAQSILANFNMSDCQPKSTPMEEGTNGSLLKTPGTDEEYPFRSLVGALIYFIKLRGLISASQSTFLADSTTAIRQNIGKQRREF